ALPEDMLVETAEVADALPYRVLETPPATADLDALQQKLEAAKNPIAILGGSRWSAEAVEQFASFATRFELPVTVQFRRQMLLPTDHPCFVGDVGIGSNPSLLEAIENSDLVIMVGGRMSETPSQSYTLFPIPRPRAGQELVHIHPDTSELNRVYRSELPIATSPIAFAQAVSDRQPSRSLTRQPLIEKLRQQYLQWSNAADITIPGDLQMGQIMAYLGDKLPADAIICNGAGNYA